VKEVLARTNDSRDARKIVQEKLKEKFGKLPKVPDYTNENVLIEPAKDYFWCKEPNPEMVEEINPLVIPRGTHERLRTSLRKLRTLVEKNPEPMTIKGNTLIPRNENA